MTSEAAPIPIAFCITELDPGGAERALVQLVTRLDRARWQPEVYALAGEAELADVLRQHDVPVTCLGAKGTANLGVVPRLASLLKKQRPHILQTFLYHANIAGRIAARIAGVPHVVSGIRVAEKRSRFRLWVDRRTDSLVDRHVCVSEAVAKFSIETGKLPADKVVVIPNGVDVERYRDAQPADLSEFGIPQDAPVVLFVGRLDEQKGPLDLLEALEPICWQYGNLHALFVGDGPQRDELERRTAAHKSGLRIHLLGRRSDVPELMKAATCLALPSRWEGMPNVVLEAMAAGLPVVATAVEGTTELLQPVGKSGAPFQSNSRGWLITRPSPLAIAEQVDNVLSHPEEASERARSAQVYVSQHLTWDIAALIYSNLYAQFLLRPT